MMDLTVREFARDYYPAIIYTLEILIAEKERRANRRKLLSRKEKRADNEPRITYNQISEILGDAFNVEKGVITAIRLHYFEQESKDVGKKKVFKGHFNPHVLVNQCRKTISYEVKKDDIDFILVLLDYARPVESFFALDNTTYHNEKTREVIDQWIDAIDKSCSSQPNASYWNLIFKNVPKLRFLDLKIIYMLITLPTIAEDRVAALNQYVGKMRSSLCIDTLKSNDEKFRYLDCFESDIKKLYKQKGWDKNGFSYCVDWKNHQILMVEDSGKTDITGFRNLSVYDLYSLYQHRDDLSSLALYPIRPQDVRLVFLYATKFNPTEQEELFKLIETEIAHSKMI